MINLTLYRREMKANIILFLIFAGVLTMYSVMIVMMFDPKLGDSLRMMSESMPELFAAFGMADVGTTLLEFVSGYLYGMLLVAFPGVFIIILSGRLIAKYVDNGSMAYLLAVPKKRWNLALTQAAVLLTYIVLLVVYVTVLIFITSHILFPDEMEVKRFLDLNIGLLGTLVFFSGVCFLPSCLLNESKRATGIGAGVVIYSILVQMIAQVGEKFENLRLITPLTLFDVDRFITEEQSAWIGCGILYFIGIVFIGIGIIIFHRRDLPI